VPLQTPSGFMTGTYGMVSATGENFDIDVPAFSLDSAESKRTLN
jgi:ApaG protein